MTTATPLEKTEALLELYRSAETLIQAARLLAIARRFSAAADALHRAGEIFAEADSGLVPTPGLAEDLHRIYAQVRAVILAAVDACRHTNGNYQGILSRAEDLLRVLRALREGRAQAIADAPEAYGQEAST